MKKCETIEEFEELIDDVYYSTKEIYFNGEKICKRKKFEDFDDIFYNGYCLSYYIENNNLYLKLYENNL